LSQHAVDISQLTESRLAECKCRLVLSTGKKFSGQKISGISGHFSGQIILTK